MLKEWVFKDSNLPTLPILPNDSVANAKELQQAVSSFLDWTRAPKMCQST